jgi:hypothetical protein
VRHGAVRTLIFELSAGQAKAASQGLSDAELTAMAAEAVDWSRGVAAYGATGSTIREAIPGAT